MADTQERTTEPLTPETEEFAQQIADQVESFLIAVRAIARGEATGGEAISMLLLVVSQVLLAGGRLGVQADFQPADEYEPDPGPDPDLDAMRHRLGVLFEDFDAFTVVFDPYDPVPQLVPELLSDELVGNRERLGRWLGHRLDDPRCLLMVVDDGDRIGGFVSGFAERGVGLVEQCVVRPARRRRGIGRSLVVSAAAALRSGGAMLIASQVDEGPGERFAEACGFAAAYPVTAYVRRVDELLD